MKRAFVLLGAFGICALGLWSSYRLHSKYEATTKSLLAEAERLSKELSSAKTEETSFNEQGSNEVALREAAKTSSDALRQKERLLKPRFAESEAGIRETHTTQTAEREKWSSTTEEKQRKVTAAQFQATQAVDTANLARMEIEKSKTAIGENEARVATLTEQLERTKALLTAANGRLGKLQTENDALQKEKLPKAQSDFTAAQKEATDLATHRTKLETLRSILAKKTNAFFGIRVGILGTKNAEEVKRLTDIGVPADIAERISLWCSTNVGPPPPEPREDRDPLIPNIPSWIK